MEPSDYTGRGSQRVSEQPPERTPSPPLAQRSNPRKKRAASDDDVEQPPGNEHDFFGNTSSKTSNGWIGHRGLDGLLLIDVASDAHLAANLAVHLHHELDRILGGQSRIERRPACIEHTALAPRGVLPQLLG